LWQGHFPGKRKDKAMKYYPWRVLIISLLVVLLLAITGSALAQSEVVEVTSPTEGDVVAGVVDVTGTVDFSDFMKYEIFLQGHGELLWAATVYAPVVDGALAKIDTRIYPDGIYQMLIRTVKTDSNYDEYTGPSFVIENNLGAPQPYPEVVSSPLYAPVAGALTRFVNCSGDDVQVDYHSPTGFCSADDLWIPFKEQNSSICPFVDVLMIPGCEYQGTVRGEGQSRGVGYTFDAVEGKVYKVIYAGDAKLYHGEVEPDERATTDTAGEGAAVVEVSKEVVVVQTDSESTQPAAPAPESTDKETDQMLPVSGQGQETPISFIIVAVGVILFLLMAGVIAMRKRGQPA
jgi:hypothetical protein